MPIAVLKKMSKALTPLANQLYIEYQLSYFLVLVAKRYIILCTLYCKTGIITVPL
jgi:hypothetical protein